MEARKHGVHPASRGFPLSDDMPIEENPEVPWRAVGEVGIHLFWPRCLAVQRALLTYPEASAITQKPVVVLANHHHSQNSEILSPQFA
jgi:hypothetical protein